MKQLHIRLLTAALFFACTSDVFAKKKKKCKTRCEKYDYVIVGGGTAGTVLANKLSAPDSKGKYKYSVCVLEAGPNLTEDPGVLQGNVYAAEISPRTSRFTESISFGTTLFAQSEGMMWGGSSGHNGLQWYRATPQIYNEWAAISGDDRWLYENLLNNVMIPIERYTPTGTVANPDQRGFEGPLFVTQAPSVNTDPASQAIASGSAAGLVSDLNNIFALTNGQVGVGANQSSATGLLADPDTVRSFGGNSFLTGIPSEDIPGIVDADGNGLNGRKIKVISNAWANRILFSKCKEAKGVEYTIGEAHDQTITVKARKGVIACCGAIYTPALLQRSGIGDAELLEELGIPVVVDNPHVGAHLENHVGGLAFLDTDCNIFPPEIGNAFLGLPPATGERVLQVLYATGDVFRFFFPQAVTTFVDLPAGGTGFLQLNVTPNSEGIVEIVNANPFRQPFVDYRNYSDGGPADPGSDADKVVSFYRDVLPAIAADAGANIIYPTPAQYAGGDEALFNAALITSVYAAHQSGTCRMGMSIEDGVVDGRLKVFGVDKLYIADASTAPVIQDANTQTQAFFTGFELGRILRGEG